MASISQAITAAKVAPMPGTLINRRCIASEPNSAAIRFLVLSFAARSDRAELTVLEAVSHPVRSIVAGVKILDHELRKCPSTAVAPIRAVDPTAHECDCA